MHCFGSEKGEIECLCEKYNETSGTRDKSSLTEQLLSVEEALLSM